MIQMYKYLVILLKCNSLRLSHTLSTAMASRLTEIKSSVLTRVPCPLVTASFFPILCLVCSIPSTWLPYFLYMLCMSPSHGLCFCCFHLIQVSAQKILVDSNPLCLKRHSVSGLFWASNLSLAILYFFFIRFIATWHISYIFAYCCSSH